MELVEDSNSQLIGLNRDALAGSDTSQTVSIGAGRASLLFSHRQSKTIIIPPSGRIDVSPDNIHK